MPSQLKKNQSIELEITGMTHEGNGVGHWEGVAVFVPLSAPGDRIRAKVVKVHSRHAFGIVEELLAPSPHRVASDCPVFTRCGGCSLRHISYEQEVQIKHGWVQENLRRIGGVDLALDPPIPSPATTGYRNKAQYPVAQAGSAVQAGFYAKRSHRVVVAGDCPLQPSIFGVITRIICDFMGEHQIPAYDEQSHGGLVRHIYLRRGEATGQVMVCLVLNGETLPRWQDLLDRLRGACPDLATLVLHCNRRRTNVILGDGPEHILFGQGFIIDELCGVSLKLSPRSFYQVNRSAAELLYRQALEYADPRPGELLLDLYCGAGAVGLSMARRAERVIGVEIVEQAVEDARENALRNGIANAEFLCADAGKGASILRERGLRPAVIVVDPPRKGLSEEAVEHAAAMAPRRIVYISCDSATLARDLARFAQLGYRAVKGRAVDLFPRTAHVEAVVLMSRE